MAKVDVKKSVHRVLTKFQQEYVKRRLRLNQKQVEQVADYTKDLSMFFFATVIAPLFVDVDSINYSMLGLGLTLSFLALILSILFLRRSEYGIYSKS